MSSPILSVFLTLIMGILFIGTQLSFSGTSKSIGLIGELDFAKYNAGIGCSFSPSGSPHKLIFSDMTASGATGPWMNLQGKVVKLEVNEIPNWPMKKGTKSNVQFSSDKIIILFMLRNVSSGSAGSYFKGRVVVDVKGQKDVMDVEGGCGD